MKSAIILGAGITGLRIGKYLVDSGYDVTVLEKSQSVGGVTGSFRYKDFILDYGPHKFYTQLPGINEDFEKIVGKDGFFKVKKINSIRLLGKYFDFPVKITQLMLGINPFLAAKIFLDMIKAKMNRKYWGKTAANYEEYFIKGFGKTGYSILFKGFAEKVWGNPQYLSEELARRRSPASSIFDVLKTAIIKNKNVSAEFFYYPKTGFGDICDNLARQIKAKKGKIITNANVKKINIKNGKVSDINLAVNGKSKKMKCDTLITTMPIDNLPFLINPLPSSEVLSSAKKLKFRSIVVCFVFLKKSRAIKENWIFFPEKEFCFNRIAEQKSFSPLTAPSDKTVLTAEITCDYGDSTFNASDEKLKEMVVRDLEKAGIAKKDEVYDFLVKKMNKVYPVYEIGYKNNLNVVLDSIDKIPNIFTVGRPGLFNYNNADHSLDMARVTSDMIIKKMPRSAWKKVRDYFDSYRIVD
jgi:protoporphyrinogen oxidase